MPEKTGLAFSTAIDRELAGEAVRFLAARALWWPRERTLFVADVHLGKAESFRRLGVPMPLGPTLGTLDRLSRLMTDLPVARLIVLGDLLHARAAQSAAVMTPLGEWRREHSRVHITLVRGNHDAHAGDPPPGLGIETVDAPHALGPFRLCHDDQDATDLAHSTHAPHTGSGRDASIGHRLEGHVHPAIRLPQRAARSLRLPCFCVGPKRTLLPAFGDFTGTALIEPAPDEAILAIAQAQIMALPAGAFGTARGPYRSAARVR